MLLRAPLFAVLSALLSAPLAFGATSGTQALSDMQALANQVEATHALLRDYNGGLARAVPLANAVYQSHQKLQVARRTIGDMDSPSDADAQRLLESYQQMHQPIVDLLALSKEKAPALRSAGVGYIARGMLSGLHDEKANFQDAMKRTLPDSHYRTVSADLDRLDSVYTDAKRAFA